MKIFTIGFTKTSAESFFTRLQEAGVKKVIDVRLHNDSQLAGFAKKDDLRYFLDALCGIDYAHLPELAPTQEMFEAYKKQKGEWTDFEKQRKKWQTAIGSHIFRNFASHPFGSGLPVQC